MQTEQLLCWKWYDKPEYTASGSNEEVLAEIRTRVPVLAKSDKILSQYNFLFPAKFNQFSLNLLTTNIIYNFLARLNLFIPLNSMTVCTESQSNYHNIFNIYRVSQKSRTTQVFHHDISFHFLHVQAHFLHVQAHFLHVQAHFLHVRS